MPLLPSLTARVDALRASSPGSRLLIGIAGCPGAGKSTLAATLVSGLGASAAGVPLDGFHLADIELRRQGLLDRKGTPETFDACGYAVLLDRLRRRTSGAVYAPGFDRTLEQPLAGAVAVAQSVDVVISEGSYLLLDRPEWRAGRSLLHEVWYVDLADELRRERLVARHVEFGKSARDAAEWVEQVDEPNARLVKASRHEADRYVDLTGW